MRRTFKRLVNRVLEPFDIAITRRSALDGSYRDAPSEPIGEADVERIRASVLDYFFERATGVLHLGAHLGQEAAFYSAKGKRVLWVEAIPDIHSQLCREIARYSDQRALLALLADTDGEAYNYHISNNANGVSSSIFEFGEYASGPKSLWPRLDLKMVRHLELASVRLDSLLEANDIDASRYDMWVVDLQGAELVALNGAGRSLAQCRSLHVEVSRVEVYKGGALWDELERHLAERGFRPLWQPLWQHDMVLFVR